MLIAMLRWLGLALLVLAIAPAQAAWLETRTDHFVIDADTSEARIRDFATRLERFDAALRRLYNVADDPAGHANPVTIFAVDPNTLSRLCRNCPAQTAGFYQPHAGRSVIVTAALGGAGLSPLTPQAVLLHEYGHHFMFASAPAGYPLWYAEGFAEFNANVEFRSDGGIVIGLPAIYRAYGLTQASRTPETGSLMARSKGALSITDVLDPPPAVLRSPIDLDQFYGRSWLLMHYLQLSPTRKGQLAVYLDRFGRGASSMAAAKEAFGDVNVLGANLSGYLSGDRLLAPLLVPPAATPVTMTIKALSPGAAELMAAHMRSSVGTTRAEASAALPAIMARAAAYSNDAGVQAWLAEAAYDAHDETAAIAASDRALAADPANLSGLLYRGRAALRLAVAGGRDPAQIGAARSWFVRANRAHPDAAEPLIDYYQSFVAAGQPPSAAAVNGLLRAIVLAPEDGDLRIMLARHFLDQKDMASAREVLTPIAYAPHSDPVNNLPRKVIDRIAADDAAGARALLTGQSDPPQ